MTIQISQGFECQFRGVALLMNRDSQFVNFAIFSPSLQGRLQEIASILDQAEEQLRRLSHELRPTILDDLGLVPALKFLTESVSRRAKLSIRINSSLEGRY